MTMRTGDYNRCLILMPVLIGKTQSLSFLRAGRWETLRGLYQARVILNYKDRGRPISGVIRYTQLIREAFSAYFYNRFRPCSDSAKE